MLLDSERRFTKHVGDAEGTPVAVLLGRVRRRIVELYQAWLNRLFALHIATRDDALLVQQEAVAKKLQQYQPDNYAGHLASAMAAFSSRRDLATARREIDACRGVDDASWRYGDAFLLAYDGDLESAYRAYRDAFRSPHSDATIPTQCEEFIQRVIEQEPERQWLYYCLGLINHRAKGDSASARADFQRFVDGADPVRFAKHIAIAKTWIAELDVLLVS